MTASLRTSTRCPLEKFESLSATTGYLEISAIYNIADETTEVNLRLHRGQLDIADTKKRFNHIRCGRQFGKSTLGYALVLAGAVNGKACAYITPAAKDYARRWEEFTEKFSSLIMKAKISQGKIFMLGGGTVDFHGTHRAEAIRGNHYNRVVVDEAAHVKNLYSVYNFIIEPTLIIKRGDLYLMSTPAGVDFEKIENVNKNKSEWAFFKKTSMDNPDVKPAEIERLRLSMPSSVFRQEILADYVDLEGARIKREWLSYTSLEPGVDYTFVAGVDPAISESEDADYTACVVVAVPPATSKLPCVVVDAQRVRIAQLEAVCSWIVTIVDHWQCEILNIEKVTFSDYLVQQLQARMPNVYTIGVPSTKSKLTRFLPLEGQIEHGYIKFSYDLSEEYLYELISFDGSPSDATRKDDQVDATVLAHKAATQQPVGFFVV